MKNWLVIAWSCFALTSQAQQEISVSPRVYLGAGRMNSFRSLTPSAAPFGKELGYRSEEKAVKVWNFEGGYMAQIHPHIVLDAGLSFAKFGESYAFESSSTDSSYNYTNTYTNIAIPLQVYGTVGSDFQLYAGGGLQPQLLQAFKTDLSVGDSLGNVTDVTTNYLENGASFSLCFRATAGIYWKLQKNIGIYLNYSYTQGLTNTYADQEAYVHKVRSYGLRYGIVYRLK